MTSISKSRMPSIPSQAGSSQQRCLETLCSSQANSRCRSEYLCEECGKLFKHPDSLTHHRKIDRGGSKCSTCVSPMHPKSLEVEGAGQAAGNIDAPRKQQPGARILQALVTSTIDSGTLVPRKHSGCQTVLGCENFPS